MGTYQSPNPIRTFEKVEKLRFYQKFHEMAVKKFVGGGSFCRKLVRKNSSEKKIVIFFGGKNVFFRFQLIFLNRTFANLDGRTFRSSGIVTDRNM